MDKSSRNIKLIASLAGLALLTGASALAQDKAAATEPVPLRLDNAPPAAVAPAPVAPAVVPVPAHAVPTVRPVEAVKAEIKTEALEKKVAPLSFSPSLNITPVGYQKKVAYFQLVPGLSFGSGMKTDNGQVFDISAGYNFTFLNFLGENPDYGIPKYNKEFQHEVTFGIGWGFAEGWKFGIDSNLHYKVVSGVGALGDNELWAEADPSISYQIHPQVNISVGMALGFWNSKDTIYYTDSGTAFMADPPDPESVRTGGFSYVPVTMHQTGMLSDPTTFFYEGTLGNNLSVKGYNFEPSANVRISCDPIPGTNLTAGYIYEIGLQENDSTNRRVGHKGTMSIKQNLWEGGSASLSYSLRYRDKPWKFVEDAGANYHEYRHDLSFGVSHTVNKYMGLSAGYTFKRRISNDENAQTEFNNNETNSFNVGTTISF